MNRIISAFLLLVILAVVSCKEKTTGVAGGNAISNAGTDTVKLQLQPGNSIRVYYDITTETKMQQTVRETEIKNDNKVEIGVAYSIKKSADSAFSFSMHYNKFKLHINSNEFEKTLDAATAASAFEPSEKIFSVFDNVTLSGVVSPNGKVSSIAGVKEMTNRMYAIAGSNEEAKEMIESSVRQYVSEAFFKGIAEQCFNVYPAKAVKPGETWELNSTVQSGLNMPVKVLYTLASIKDDIATITLQSDIELSDKPLDIDGNRVTANLQGQQSGEMKIRLSNGLLQTGNSSLKIKGNITAMGQEVPISLSTTTTIVSR